MACTGTDKAVLGFFAQMHRDRWDRVFGMKGFHHFSYCTMVIEKIRVPHTGDKVVGVSGRTGTNWLMLELQGTRLGHSKTGACAVSVSVHK